MEHDRWLRLLSDDARRAIRKHVLVDDAWKHITAHPPLVLREAPAHRVRDHRDGSAAVQFEIESKHEYGHRPGGKRNSPILMLLIGAECGTGKTLGATKASRSIDIAYTAPQYSHLDAFFGHRPYQIQGMQKGCRIMGLGLPATERGVRRNYLCWSENDRCPLLAKCPAQPRIKSKQTPTFTHASLPTAASGAVVEDGVILRGEDVGKPIGAGCALVIDEAPDFWSESTCTAEDIRTAIELKGFIDSPSRARGEPFREYEDAMCRIAFLVRLSMALSAVMSEEPHAVDGSYATTWPADRVGPIVEALVAELEVEPIYVGLRALFRTGMVPDPTKMNGERLCIPQQRQWTASISGAERRSREHVEELIPSVVIDACRAVAHVLEDGGKGDTSLVATLDGEEVTLRVMKLNPMALPGATCSVVMSAGMAMLARLLPAVFPQRDIEVVSIEREQRSATKRTLLATAALGRKSARRAFGSSTGSMAGPPASGSTGRRRLSKAQLSYLGTLRRAIYEASLRVARVTDSGELHQVRQRALLVVFEPICQWLLDTQEGQAWLGANTPENLCFTPGEPWGSKPEKWGSIIYWGGRGRGENQWQDHRVAITVGDPIPNIGDMEARWGDKKDPQTGRPFDPFEVAVWYAQESTMQALERTRPGREGEPTVLVHAGRYLPMGFGDDSEIIVAEESRLEAVMRRTDARVLNALAEEVIENDGRVPQRVVARIAESAEVDTKTVRKALRRVTESELKAAELGAATSGICLLNYLERQIPNIAALRALLVDSLNDPSSVAKGLPTANDAVAILERELPGLDLRCERTLRKHLGAIREDLTAGEPLRIPVRSDARSGWLRALIACLAQFGHLDSVIARAEGGAQDE